MGNLRIVFQVQFKLYYEGKEIHHDTEIIVMDKDIKTPADLSAMRLKILDTQMDYYEGTSKKRENFTVGIIDYKVVQVM